MNAVRGQKIKMSPTDWAITERCASRGGRSTNSIATEFLIYNVVRPEQRRQRIQPDGRSGLSAQDASGRSARRDDAEEGQAGAEKREEPEGVIEPAV